MTGRSVRTPARPRSNERGASAVEFALLVPLLVMLVFGIIDYGLWFSNSLSVRQGVRESARQAVVARYNDGSSCQTGTPAEQIACSTDRLIGAINGTPYTKVVVPGTWAQGQQLLVCSIVVSDSVTGFTPLPNGGSVRSATRMSVEVVPASNVPAAGHQEGPSSLDWSWCA